MNKQISLLLIALVTLFGCKSRRPLPPAPAIEKGVSRELADFRKATIGQVRYTLHFTIPSAEQTQIPASQDIEFNWHRNSAPLELDFKAPKDYLSELKVNDKVYPIAYKDEHLLISPDALKEGHNTVHIVFRAGEQSLNRHADYLYTLLVPDRARTLFPCFDQPDLKAVFSLVLSIPKDWTAVASAPLQRSDTGDDVKTLIYQPSDTIPTYLFSFVAGKFKKATREAGGRPMNFYYRETDSARIAQSLGPIFEAHARSLAFLQDYTQIPYPFKKFDFVAIPAFQYGGMEHVGAIQYNASSLFLDTGATEGQKINRANVIAHETAHNWFGDLVTMRWFNDVWMKEVFANFMADKISPLLLTDTNSNLRFLVTHYPAAYDVDRTAGSNPIRQPLGNLQNAGSLYGSIIYHKAPIMMRQLEALMGPGAFRDGIREYLKKYAWGNASWPDLVRILDRHTPADLQAWNKVWVNEPGRPKFDYELELKDQKISRLVLSQKGEDGSDRIWPQIFDISLVYPDHIKTLPVNMKDSQVALSAAAGLPAPSYIVFNSNGAGYGIFPVDLPMLPRLFDLTDPVMRAAACINLYENALSGRFVAPAQLVNLYRSHLKQEPEELNIRLLTGQVAHLFWQFMRPEQRAELAPALEKELWSAMQQAGTAGRKKVLFRAYENISLTREAQDRLYSIWKNRQAPRGIYLSEEDYTTLAQRLALRDYPRPGILQEQLSRITNPDRRKEMAFVIPALSPDIKTRDSFFVSLKEEKNRENESWVIEALYYLHHPLRAATSEKYLPESLSLLEEIRQTGDIFFPKSWLQATFGSYQSPEAARVVRNFLQAHPQYNKRLKAKILQSADDLFRAEKLLYPEKK